MTSRLTITVDNTTLRRILSLNRQNYASFPVISPKELSLLFKNQLPVLPQTPIIHRDGLTCAFSSEGSGAAKARPSSLTCASCRWAPTPTVIQRFITDPEWNSHLPHYMYACTHVCMIVYICVFRRMRACLHFWMSILKDCVCGGVHVYVCVLIFTDCTFLSCPSPYFLFFSFSFSFLSPCTSHLLEYFQDFRLQSIMGEGWIQPESDLWTGKCWGRREQ